MKRLEGGVTAAKGFQAAGIYAGIKKNNKSDMAMVYSEVPCIAAGTFTTNLVKAAPVKWDQKVVKESDSAQAIVVNSGVANACTGEEGYQSCMDMAKKANTQLICLTGLGGESIYNRFDNIYVLNLIAASLRNGMQYLKVDRVKGNEPETMVVSQIEVVEQMELTF